MSSPSTISSAHEHTRAALEQASRDASQLDACSDAANTSTSARVSHGEICDAAMEPTWRVDAAGTGTQPAAAPSSQCDGSTASLGRTRDGGEQRRATQSAASEASSWASQDCIEEDELYQSLAENDLALVPHGLSLESHLARVIYEYGRGEWHIASNSEAGHGDAPHQPYIFSLLRAQPEPLRQRSCTARMQATPPRASWMRADSLMSIDRAFNARPAAMVDASTSMAPGDLPDPPRYITLPTPGDLHRPQQLVRRTSSLQVAMSTSWPQQQAEVTLRCSSISSDSRLATAPGQGTMCGAAQSPSESVRTPGPPDDLLFWNQNTSSQILVARTPMHADTSRTGPETPDRRTFNDENMDPASGSQRTSAGPPHLHQDRHYPVPVSSQLAAMHGAQERTSHSLASRHTLLDHLPRQEPVHRDGASAARAAAELLVRETYESLMARQGHTHLYAAHRQVAPAAPSADGHDLGETSEEHRAATPEPGRYVDIFRGRYMGDESADTDRQGLRRTNSDPTGLHSTFVPSESESEEGQEGPPPDTTRVHTVRVGGIDRLASYYADILHDMQLPHSKDLMAQTLNIFNDASSSGSLASRLSAHDAAATRLTLSPSSRLSGAPAIEDVTDLRMERCYFVKAAVASSAGERRSSGAAACRPFLVERIRLDAGVGSRATLESVSARPNDLQHELTQQAQKMTDSRSCDGAEVIELGAVNQGPSGDVAPTHVTFNARSYVSDQDVRPDDPARSEESAAGSTILADETTAACNTAHVSRPAATPEGAAVCVDSDEAARRGRSVSGAAAELSSCHSAPAAEDTQIADWFLAERSWQAADWPAQDSGTESASLVALVQGRCPSRTTRSADCASQSVPCGSVHTGFAAKGSLSYQDSWAEGARGPDVPCIDVYEGAEILRHEEQSALLHRGSCDGDGGHADHRMTSPELSNEVSQSVWQHAASDDRSGVWQNSGRSARSKRGVASSRPKRSQLHVAAKRGALQAETTRGPLQVGPAPGACTSASPAVRLGEGCVRKLPPLTQQISHVDHGPGDPGAQDPRHVCAHQSLRTHELSMSKILAHAAAAERRPLRGPTHSMLRLEPLRCPAARPLAARETGAVPARFHGSELHSKRTKCVRDEESARRVRSEDQRAYNERCLGQRQRSGVRAKAAAPTKRTKLPNIMGRPERGLRLRRQLQGDRDVALAPTCLPAVRMARAAP